MAWTLFWDMNSGGGRKEKWRYIYIEETKENAKRVFYNRFGHNPERITCTCCGKDYVIKESKTLEESTKYHRGKQSIDEYISNNNDILIIKKSDIKDDDLIGEIPQQGWVYMG